MFLQIDDFIGQSHAGAAAVLDRDQTCSKLGQASIRAQAPSFTQAVKSVCIFLA